ncbi:MAG: hypothetical protein BGO41_14625 [Clostridiales bacterium 38-18]|nr:MAG: hypothetical protein BGO41_14625 [Clostridiales bacterium 38-18]
MKKNMVVLLGGIVLIASFVLVGQIAFQLPNDYIRPLPLTKTEEKVLDLVEFDNIIQIFEIKKSKSMETRTNLSAYVYEDGELIHNEILLSYSGTDEIESNLVMDLENLDTDKQLRMNIKDAVEGSHMKISHVIDMSFIDGEVKAWSYDFITEAVDLTNVSEATIGCYVFSEDGSLRTLSVDTFDKDPDYIKSFDNVVLFKLSFNADI